MDQYDVIIVGGGMAGYTAGIYASRARLKTVMFEGELTGGQLNMVTDMENYPGFESVSGPELTALMDKQARKFGLEVVSEKVVSVTSEGQLKNVKTTKGEYKCYAVIVCSGASPRKLNAPGEDKLLGRGVSYCATCDGAFFKDKIIASIGGGNTACEESLFLTQFASKVYLIHRRDELRAEKILQERLFNNDKIEPVWNSVVEEISGDKLVDKIVLKNVETNESREISVNGVFIFIGHVPVSDFLPENLERDKAGYIKVDVNMATNIEGVFAAGDVISKSVRQAVTSAGDACVAAVNAEKYIMLIKGSSYGENVFK